MPSRFTQYGGALGAEAELRQIVAEKMMAQAAAEKFQQQQLENAMKVHQLGQGDRRMDIDQEQFGQTHGLNVEKLGQEKTEFEAGAPQREAQTGYLRTQTRDLEQKPLYQEAERQHDLTLAETQGRIRTGHIAQQTAADANSGADDLRTFEEKEKIKAKYGGSRPSLGAERTALAYYNRAKEANETITPLEEGISQAGLMGDLQLQYGHNVLQSTQQQQYRQTQRAFTEARLRKESGAAIPTAEYENDARTYFAQPGDSPTVMAQKRQGRQAVLDGLKFASGKAYEEFYGEPNQSPAQQQAPPQGGGGGVTIKNIRQVR
jgi:hypothetical protein